MVKRHRQSQRPYKGGRLPVGSAFIPPLEAAIEREMARYGVSRSFVIATACAYAFGVDEQEDYHRGPGRVDELRVRRRRRRGAERPPPSGWS